jgi:hypothetical protein
MGSRLKRTKSWQETLQNVARARAFAARYGLDDAHPGEYLPQPDEQQADWDNLLNQLK